ncbi:hypothetical protein [Brevibacillus fluminis]|uniref:hypothetical protein n=1 Tax=Brevibacillus fluminis TaxID=511487 RepID=UPI0011CE5C7D|nr:hypothetical protein [Brevibacillus fluminis]
MSAGTEDGYERKRWRRRLRQQVAWPSFLVVEKCNRSSAKKHGVARFSKLEWELAVCGML